jgi:hypothetical protein
MFGIFGFVGLVFSSAPMIKEIFEVIARLCFMHMGPFFGRGQRQRTKEETWIISAIKKRK